MSFNLSEHSDSYSNSSTVRLFQWEISEDPQNNIHIICCHCGPEEAFLCFSERRHGRLHFFTDIDSVRVVSILSGYSVMDQILMNLFFYHVTVVFECILNTASYSVTAVFSLLMQYFSVIVILKSSKYEFCNILGQFWVIYWFAERENTSLLETENIWLKRKLLHPWVTATL